MKEFWQRRVPALLLTVLMLVGTAIPVTANPGDSSEGSPSGSPSGSEATDPQYTVTFINSGSPYATQTNINKGDCPTDPGTPSKTAASNCSYTFAGWTTSDPGADATYTGQSVYEVATQPVTADITYYAVYSVMATNRNVSMDVTGTVGTTVGSTVRDKLNSMFSSVAGGRNFTAVTFSSVSSSDYGTLYASSDMAPIAGTYSYSGDHPITNLYFVPTDKSGICTVTYSATDGYNTVEGMLSINSTCPPTAKCTVTFINSGSPYKGQDINQGTCPANPGTPSKTASNCSYSFRGWTTSNPGTTAIYTGQTIHTSEWVAQTSVTSNVTYYAVYSVVATNQNGSVDVTGTGDTTVGTAVRNQLNSLFSSVSGRNFTTVTFSSVSNSSYGTLYANSGKTSLTGRTYSYSGGTYPITNLYFVPSGTRGTYSVTYSAQDEYTTVQGILSINTTSSPVAKYTVTFINSGSTFTGQNINQGACPANPGTPSKTASNCSYSFRGWTTSNPGTTAIYAGQSVLSSAQVAQTSVTSNVTYYAVYVVAATNQNGSVDVTGTGDVTIGTAVRNQLNSLFSSVSGRTFTTVTFSSVSNSSYGTLYANSGKTSLTGRTYSYSGGTYPVTDLYFVPSGTRGTYSVTYSASDGYSTVRGTLSINSTAASNTRITYTVRPGQKASLDRSDFNDVFRTGYSDTVRWVEFTSVGSFSSSDGTFYYNYGRSDQREFSCSTVDDYAYYYSDSSYGEYPIDNLSFVAGAAASRKTISVSFRAYYSNSRYVDGTMEIQINGSASAITYQVDQGEEVELSRGDFNRMFEDTYSRYDLRYVNFTSGSSYDTSDGTFYYDYGGRNERAFTRGNLTDYTYYYDSSSYGDYALDNLSFVASSSFTGSMTLPFRAYYDSDHYVDGTLVIEAKESVNRGDVRYYTTGSTNVQINPNDIARFLKKTYSGSTLQSVKLRDVPETGTLYYNYYGVSGYGASDLRLTSSNCDDQLLYFSPSGTSQYALSELTYVPSGSNYCVTIPFTAYGTGNHTAEGDILISVNSVTVQDVYGATPKNTSVTFPASAIYNAVATAVTSKTSLYSIQLLELPTSSKGTIYVGTGSTRANTTTRYTYSGSSGIGRISDLRFLPASGFTGSVEIPYVAYNSSDRAIASGRLCLGIVGSLKSYRDVSTSAWCYKYVAELSDGKVIDGYPDGYFRPDKTVTYGQALKLIMLAADYSAQAPTGRHPFSGYLARAKAAGLLTGVKDSDLDRPISRLAVAQITARAMRLDLSNLSSVKPFTDTSDVYVQALSAAGIVEGYFSNGTSTFKPSNTMTRGQISAIVWRMNRAK